ncbi:MAG: ferritin-like domain-containing protein [Rhodothermales bacterium]
MSDLASPFASPADPRASRRSFLKLAGLGGAVLVAAGCDSDDPDDMQDGVVTLDFSNDFGVLNYAYALEQLEAAFYATVVMNAAFSSTFDADEQAILRDLAAHEGIHRDFLKAAIAMNGGTPIPNLTPNFTSIDFASRSSVLGTAQVFEDLGVAAYNGAGQYLSDGTFLTIAGKIVSVEARHASVISSLLSANSIAGSGVIDANGLDRALAPSAVLTAASDFIIDDIRAINA